MKRLAQAAPIQRQQFLQNSISIFAGMQAVLAIAGNPARFERDLIGTERTEEQVGEPAWQFKPSNRPVASIFVS